MGDQRKNQRKDRQLTIEKLLLLIDANKKLNQPTSFLDIVFHIFIFTKYEFCTNLACIYFRKRHLKKALRVFNFANSRIS